MVVPMRGLLLWAMCGGYGGCSDEGTAAVGHGHLPWDILSVNIEILLCS